jgi:Ras family protein T1
VGKSSLISTFVSRYFSEVVPSVMTRVRLPPDPETNCITTIVDSASNEVVLQPPQQQAPFVTTTLELVPDVIVLVYDLDRSETFYRLESHWLPLIERCYQGEVSSFETLAQFFV